MTEFERLLAFCKIVYENIFVLHHNLVGKGWFNDHERLGEFYEDIASKSDDLIEAGLMLGYREPSIAESVLQFQSDVIPVQKRDAEESFRIVMENYRSIAGLINAAKSAVPDDVRNKMEEISYDLNLTANYKISNLLEIAPGGMEDDD